MNSTETSTTTEAALSSEARLPDALRDELWRRSGAADFGVDAAEFASILEQIAARYLPGAGWSSLGAAAVADFCRSLRLQDLALARACAAGHEAAWNAFLIRYRQGLARTALAIVREESAARELADSVYAELYGLESRDGQRISKLAHYDGRGSLEGWLRSVLAHEFTDRHRREHRLVSLDEQVEAGRDFRAAEAESSASPDPRVEAATDEALAAVSAEERLLLASYYLDGQTLGAIAALLGVHESTVSRRLDRIVRALTKDVVKRLRQRGFSRDQVREALKVDVRDLAVDVRRQLRGARDEPRTVLSTESKE
ncbi:MAG TPA: sigma-70 family RNA polymerase sigma factor [Terriglobia bacterium]|nr:sigma-70 family RNA polymerase sigma factor [Terriglobia bacterium]